jgi:hypothetical protein
MKPAMKNSNNKYDTTNNTKDNHKLFPLDLVVERIKGMQV